MKKKKKLRESVPSRTTLKDWLKEVLKTEVNDKRRCLNTYLIISYTKINFKKSKSYNYETLRRKRRSKSV